MKSAVTLLVLALATATLPACGDDPAPAAPAAADAAAGSSAGPAAAPSSTPNGRSGLGSARPSPTPATVA
ncbi:hypothetical protein EAD96_12795, partial [Micromonospora sp. BL1]